MNRATHHLDQSNCLMFRLQDHPTGSHLRINDHHIHPAYQGCRDALPIEELQPLA